MDRKTILVGLASFLLIGVVAAGIFLFSKPASFRGTTYAEPYPVASEIELTHENGTSFRLSGRRGKVVALFFGYTSCPDICPTTMAELNQALGKLGNQADQVQVLFITVDPQRDTPERVQEYVNHFNPSFVGLSGSVSELAKVWNDYGVFVEIVDGTSAAGYLVNHTARVTLIDQQGNLRVSFPFDTPVEDVVHDLNLLLK
ncbi:MAG TPA: SCO family protein [Anaerolineales bacterium]|nr:SCO family protein [Anaerolineales bacterium]